MRHRDRGLKFTQEDFTSDNPFKQIAAMQRHEKKASSFAG